MSTTPDHPYEILNRLHGVEKDLIGVKNSLDLVVERLNVIDDSRKKLEYMVEEQEIKIDALKDSMVKIEQVLTSNESIRKILIAVLTASLTTLAALLVKWYFVGLTNL
jgi:hypothetical protein